MQKKMNSSGKSSRDYTAISRLISSIFDTYLYLVVGCIFKAPCTMTIQGT